jgi:hypothetical protein
LGECSMTARTGETAATPARARRSLAEGYPSSKFQRSLQGGVVRRWSVVGVGLWLAACAGTFADIEPPEVSLAAPFEVPAFGKALVPVGIIVLPHEGGYPDLRAAQRGFRRALLRLG